MTLIGLIGCASTGKTTSAEYLIKKYGFVENSFATPLKKICKELFLLTDSQLYGSQEQKEEPDHRWFGCSPRTMMQFIGTDLFRNNLGTIMPGLGKNIFVHHFSLWYQDYIVKNPGACVVISDLRFLNEIEAIQSLGGYLIKIERTLRLNSYSDHESETAIRNINIYNRLIQNDGSLEDLYRQLDECVDACRSM